MESKSEDCSRVEVGRGAGCCGFDLSRVAIASGSRISYFMSKGGRNPIAITNSTPSAQFANSNSNGKFRYHDEQGTANDNDNSSKLLISSATSSTSLSNDR
jgi:hypothetical protein